MDHRFQPDIGKVRFNQHIHHAPGLIGGVPRQIATDGAAHAAARPVAPDDIAGAYHLLPGGGAFGRVFNSHCYGVFCRIIA